MLKKKYNLNKQLALKVNYLENYLSNLLIRSLTENQNLNPIDRLSFFMKGSDQFNFFNHFSTYQKLHCLITLSPKVPNKSYHYSRFFFNKQLNYLVCANTLK
jgi:hypothetical protein